MISVKIHVKDIPWEFIVQTDDDYKENHGKDSYGITYKHDLKVYLKESELSLRLIKHEMFHVFHGSCCINSTNEITVEDMEEIGADIIEFHGEDLLKLSKKVYNTLKHELEKQNARKSISNHS